jgi:tellurite resistance protein
MFGIPFGITGLAAAWQAAAPVLGVPLAVARVLNIVAAVVWFLLVAGYLAQGRRQVLADLTDQVLSPFVPLAWVCAMLLGAALARQWPAGGRVVVVVFLVLTIAHGGWLTGRWVSGDIDTDRVHPGYFLPTVAGGLVGALAAAEVHLHAVAEISLGIGILCWLLLGSIVLNRLFLRPGLPAALVPTLAIELAPPAVAGIAYFAVTGDRVNVIGYGLAGYTVLMALVQVSQVPRYLKLHFMPSFWAFTFSYAAAATDALIWIRVTHPAGGAGYAVVILTAISVLIVAIGARTVLALARGQFFPGPPSPN